MKISKHISQLSGAPIAFILFAVMYLVYALRMPSALTLFSITNLLNNTVVLAIAASGLTIVILTKEMDVSSVGVIAVANVLVATQSRHLPYGSLVCFIIVCSFGILIGFINGFLVAYLGIQSLACTIATMFMCQGLALLILPAPGGQVANFISYELVSVMLYIIPISGMILLLTALLWVYLKKTVFGIGIYSVGTDENAARLSGIDVRRVKLGSFILAGLLYGIAGYLLSAQIGSGDPRVSTSFLLYVFAAVAIGGTSLFGGRGGIIGTLGGAGILTIMQNMLFSLGVADFYTNIFNGLIMIFAIFIGDFAQIVVKWKEIKANLSLAGK